jgi:hypothetical protein
MASGRPGGDSRRSFRAPRPAISFTARGDVPVRYAQRTEYRRYGDQEGPCLRQKRAFIPRGADA